MIRLVNSLPDMSFESAELIKIKCIYQSYKDIALFWVQDNNRCIIAMLDGNMVILNLNADIDELKEFVEFIAPYSVFTDVVTLTALACTSFEEAVVMRSKAIEMSEFVSDKLSSREIYELLMVKEFQLPEYEYFAVDFCHRLNGGYAEYFALNDRCVAISINTDEYFLINGIASHQKGFGTIALKGICARNYPKTAVACCREELRGFYEKNGFEMLYRVGYWVI